MPWKLPLVLVVLLFVGGCAGPAGGPGAGTATAPETMGAGTGTPAEDGASGSPRAPSGTDADTEPGEDVTRSVAFVVGGDRRATVTVEVADSPAERRRGLMGRRSLPEDRGMLFVFPDEAPRTFWMKNTYVPLDMVFVDANGTVVDVDHAAPQPNAPPSELERYHSDGPAKYVIEVNRGFANRTGIGPGARVVFDAAGTPGRTAGGTG